MAVAAAMVRALVDGVERAGVSKAEFIRRAGCNFERLHDPFGRFDFAEHDALQRLALDSTGDPALGLHVIEHCSEAAFDLLPHLLPLAPTLRHALGLCAQFASLLMEGSVVTVEETAELARLGYAFHRCSADSDRVHADLAVAGLHRLIRSFGGQRAAVHSVHFEHVEPGYRREYERILGVRVRFNRPFTGIEFERSLLDRLHLHHQPSTYSLLWGEAQRLLDAVAGGRGQTERVRQYLMAHAASCVPKMSAAARDLGMSARSLRRRLLQEGSCYRALVDERLESVALQVLRSPGKSAQEAARATGFSDSAAFHRAFKKWTGISPSEFQRERQN